LVNTAVSSGTSSVAGLTISTTSAQTGIVTSSAAGLTIAPTLTQTDIVTSSTRMFGPNGGLIVVASANGMSSDPGAIQVHSTYGSQGTNLSMSLSTASADGLLCCAGGPIVDINPIYISGFSSYNTACLCLFSSSSISISLFSSISLFLQPQPNYQNNKPSAIGFWFNPNIHMYNRALQLILENEPVTGGIGLVSGPTGSVSGPTPPILVGTNSFVEEFVSLNKQYHCR